MKTANICIAAAALLAGAAIGYCIKPSAAPSEPAPAGDNAEKASHPRKGDGGHSVEKILRERIAALNGRIKDLEAQLAAKAEGGEGGRPEESAVREERRPPMEDFRARMERLKIEEPERYAQMTNRMAQFRQRNLERMQSKMDFLASIDPATLPPAARESHSALMDLIEKRAEIDGKFSNFDSMTDEERHAAFGEMREVDGDIRRLSKSVRNDLLRQTAKEVGFKGEDAKVFVETVKGIIDATDGNFGGHGGPPRGPGGPGRR